ncbi:amidase family protein [Natronococcus sp.]|uniref:amidase family protein n=1 Tax=Natronococcus sp. TaxID=35747 RepID=UPI003743AB91
MRFWQIWRSTGRPTTRSSRSRSTGSDGAPDARRVVAVRPWLKPLESRLSVRSCDGHYGRENTQRSAAGIVREIRDGELSPVGVVDDHLERIDERNDRTNAFVTVAEESAREAAAEAERAIEDGEPLGPHHGVPVAVKDIDDVAGVETTHGSRLRAGHVADADRPRGDPRGVLHDGDGSLAGGPRRTRGARVRSARRGS